MSTYYPDFTHPSTLDDSEVEFLRPVAGPTLQNASNVVNHIELWKGRRAAHVDVDWGDGAILQSPDSLVTPIRVWWKSNEFARSVMLVVRYTTYSSVSGGPSLAVILRRKTGSPGAGATEDAGFTWTEGNGLVSGRTRSANSTFSTSYLYEVNTVSTGVLVPPLSGLTIPHPLSIGAAWAGGWVELSLTPNGVRVLSIDAIEIPAESVTL